MDIKICRTCLTKDNILSSLKTDDNLIINKLETVIPELEWLETFFICQECSRELEVAFNFREKCLKSHKDFFSISIKDERQTFEETKSEFVIDNCKTQLGSPISYRSDLEDDRDDSEHENYTEESVKIEDDKLNGNSVELEDDKNKPSSCNESVKENIKDEDYVEKKVRKKRKSKIQKSNKVVRIRTKSYSCEKCEIKCTSTKNFFEHCENVHAIDRKDIRPYSCSKCDKRFKTSTNLQQHLKYHKGTRTEICSYCGKGFITKADLFVHEKIHFNKKSYLCQICDKSFNTHKNLGTHKLIVHTDPSLWNYVCSFCNKRFPQKSNMTAHVRRHKGEKLFECHLCQKKFCENGTLKKHIQTHSNVRNNRCSECGKEYKERKVMEIHMAKIHGIGDVPIPVRTKKYICHICPKSYFDRNKLTRHLYTHTGEKPFRCVVCEKSFIDKNYLANHVKNTHAKTLKAAV